MTSDVKLSYYFLLIEVINRGLFLKETRNSFKKCHLNLWWISKKPLPRSWKYYKSCHFCRFSSPKLLKHTVTFFVTVLFVIFMKQTSTDDIWGLHKNMNCAFPLTLKSFRKQFQSTTQSVNVGKLLRLSTYHCKLLF